MLLLQEFNYKVQVRPGKSHSNADFFSRIEGRPDPHEINDQFPDEEIFHVATDKPTKYADIISYLLTAKVPRDLTTQQIAVFLQKAAPYLLVKGVLHKVRADSMMRRCLEENEKLVVLKALHEEADGGHYAKDVTARKVLNA